MNEDGLTSSVRDKILTITVKKGWKQGTRITFPQEGDQGPNNIPGTWSIKMIIRTGVASIKLAFYSSPAGEQQSIVMRPVCLFVCLSVHRHSIMSVRLSICRKSYALICINFALNMHEGRGRKRAPMRQRMDIQITH